MPLLMMPLQNYTELVNKDKYSQHVVDYLYDTHTQHETSIQKNHCKIDMILVQNMQDISITQRKAIWKTSGYKKNNE